MGIAKRCHQKVVEGVITHARAESIVKKLLTRRSEPVAGKQMLLFGRNRK